MKVGDLVICDHYGIGIITDKTVDDWGTTFGAYFYEVSKEAWFDAGLLGDSMELISESR